MFATNKSTASIWTGLILVFAALMWSCTPNCPNPNPTISVDEDGAYIVKTDSVPNATSVVILSSSAQGQLLDSVSLNVGDSHLYYYDDETLYPIQLKFSYKSSTGDVVAEDRLQLGIIDINSGGTTAMDVIMGFAPPNPAPSIPPSCPNTSVIATGSGEVIFSWANNDWFDVSITHGATVQTIGIQPKDGQNGLPGTVNVYRNDIYSCLTNPSCQVSQDLHTCMVPVSQSGTSILSGSNDGTTRQLKLIGTGCTFVVKKKQ